MKDLIFIYHFLQFWLMNDRWNDMIKERIQGGWIYAKQETALWDYRSCAVRCYGNWRTGRKNQLYTAAFFQSHPSPRKSNPFCGKIPIFKMQMSNSYWMFPPQPQAGFLPHWRKRENWCKSEMDAIGLINCLIIASQEIIATFKRLICDMQFRTAAVALKSWIDINM